MPIKPQQANAATKQKQNPPLASFKLPSVTCSDATPVGTLQTEFNSEDTPLPKPIEDQSSSIGYPLKRSRFWPSPDMHLLELPRITRISAKGLNYGTPS